MTKVESDNVMALAGSAWADETTVRAAINTYGLSDGGGSGSTITVSGSVSKLASQVLDLGDITGLVIDWKADLTVSGGNKPSGVTGVINFSGNGKFKLTAGTINIESANGWVWAICASSGSPEVILDGSTITSDRAQTSGIEIGESIEEGKTSQGKLTINSGTLSIPKGIGAFAKTLEVTGGTINGALGMVDSDDKMTLYFYGNATTVLESDIFFNEYEPGQITSNSRHYIAKSGATWNIESVASDMTAVPVDAITMEVENGATINLKNTDLKFKGTFDVDQGGELNIGVIQGDTSRVTNVGGTSTNDGTINIYGTLTNNGRFLNDSTGKITNTGTIDNTNDGTIENKGTIDNTNGKINNEGTIKSDSFIANVGGNPVVPLYGNPEVKFPTSAVVAAAEAAMAKGLTLPPASLQAATQESCISQGKIIEDKKLEAEVISKVSSAIAFEQELTEKKGGALVVGKLTLPYNDKSLSGESLPPLNAGNYKVFKHFKYGGWVNLSDLGIVDVSGDGAKITATLIIIDGEPGNESGVTKPVGGMDCCGVKLVDSGGEKYLFIYDGYEDGVALDPIALENYSAGGESGDGGGGCNAGIPLAGLLSLCGLALCLRKKH
jgi:hypothetical protein